MVALIAALMAAASASEADESSADIEESNPVHPDYAYRLN